eukprot:CAMPEP_0184868126 /NCGR_PEP_ID=MMETSP0580-20130426/29227_1 /TAXON_ID=1118495 /ORGANISM="Dactyliosolen fragilissimus" /LENGTH=555 /DNA_ID=CAMNT_0027368795 /DNA_START=363 /DNA_END=2030 /DNA_ORIENTATION=-
MLSITNTFKTFIAACLTGFGLPIAGYKYAGWGGLVVGGIFGGIGGGLMAFGGCILSAVQIVRGLFRTPSTLYDSARAALGIESPMITTTKTQTGYVLDEEDEYIRSLEMKRTERLASSSARATSNVKDMTYYNVLSVPSDASQSQIKRAYYEAAKQFHPDKNLDKDAEEVTEKFRKIHMAYKVLSQPERRQKYDKYGHNPNTSMGEEDSPDIDWFDKLDPFEFFAILFGSKSVEPYVGELRIARDIDWWFRIVKIAIEKGKSGESMTFEDLKDIPHNIDDVEQEIEEEDEHTSSTFGSSFSFHKKVSTLDQRRRVLEIAKHLRHRLSKLESRQMTPAIFRHDCTNEAMNILKESPDFGGVFLSAIGKALSIETDRFLISSSYFGGVFGKIPASIQKRWVKKKLDLDIYKVWYHSIKLLIGAIRDSFESKDGEYVSNNEILNNNLHNILPGILQEIAWTLNIRDITHTLMGACTKVLQDEGVSIKARLLRAQAMKILSEEFLKVANKASNGIKDSDILTRAGVALQSATLSAHGNDVPQNVEEIIQQQKQGQNRKH